MRAGFAMVASGLVAVLAMSAAAGDARADGSSIVTLGVGSGLGVHKASGPGEPANTAFINQANLRLKFLWILGLDYALDLGKDDGLVATAEGDLHYRAKMRLTALVYPYSGNDLAFYIGAGIGGSKVAELVKTDAAANSYHGGLGFEFHLGPHISVDTSFMLIAPGARSVEGAATARVEAALATGDAGAMDQLRAPGLDDFISLKNHEFMVRVFLFL